jgi:hypothetical protein
MCNCGQKRASIATRTETAAPSRSARTPRAIAMPTIRYEYTGNTGLTVFGGATRGRYRFSHPGAQVAVDARDGASLDGVPTLTRVSPRSQSGVSIP